jgi:hypothetical protein
LRQTRVLQTVYTSVCKNIPIANLSPLARCKICVIKM